MLGGSSSRTRTNYRQRSGARHQLAPECGKSSLRPAISSTSTTRQSQQRSGARQQLRLRSWLWFYDNNSPTSTSSTMAEPTTAHPIKAKFSSSKSQLSFTFAATDTRGLRHEKSSCISLTSIFFCESPRAGVPYRILDNLVYSRTSSTNGWQGTNLRRQANKKA
jgi:hypothetical protein